MAPLGPALVADDLETYRRELTGYCYRMLGSGSEAEDAVQETLLRAWRHADDFEGRSSVRSWLYRIATNVCIDMSRQVQRRARPMDMGPASPPDERYLGQPLPEVLWITPIADDRVGPHAIGADPADIVEYRESIRLAFIAAIARLPARQRAALILCEVLNMPAAEVAPILQTSVQAVNSALQRARATLRETDDGSRRSTSEGNSDDGTDMSARVTTDMRLLQRYVDAFERYDIEAFVTLLHSDAIQSMPPFAMWLEGADNIGAWMIQPGPSACRGSRLVATRANGCPAFAQYRRDPAGGYAPWGVHVLELVDGKIAAINTFLQLFETDRLFSSLGLPEHLDGQPT